MVVTVGSMAVTGKFAAGAILSGLSNIISKIKQTGFESKNLKTEMGRMTGAMTAMSAAAGITGAALLAMLVRAVMTSPLLAGALAKLRIAFMLFGNTIAKHVKPIIEWVIKGVKWLHEKFKALPDSVQSAIVKFVIIGGVILTLIPIVLILISVLGIVKTGLIALGAPAIIAALGGTGVILLTLAVVVAAVLATILILRSKVPEFFAELGEGFRTATGSAAVLRDMVMMLVGYFGAMGLAAIDIARGDFGLPRMHAAMEEMENVKHRLWTGEGYEGETSTAISLPEGTGGGQSIETQTNTTYIDFNGATFEVPAGPDGMKDLLAQIEEYKTQDLQTKQV